MKGRLPVHEIYLISHSHYQKQCTMQIPETGKIFKGNIYIAINIKYESAFVLLAFTIT